ncbi:single-stranded-DNA-specific exonuclease RecJ [Pelagibacteraceae bacterium]|nr:single-stranded-DNA-specific exonuclease RecJ [Pelagibacteraceae bacterium]
MNFVSVNGKNWIFKKFNSNDVKNYSEAFSINETLSKLIAIRKNNIEDVGLYLNPTIKNLLPNPFYLKDMTKAVKRSYKSILNKETIGIFGDYDVDGAASTAILSLYFSQIKSKSITYIPDRKKEGYGPTVQGFKNLIKSGSKIIFTVDCGTLSFEAIKFSQSQKIDVIVLDHHQSDAKFPIAHAIVNPNRHDDTSKLNYLCATGVCFMYLIALNKKLRETNWFEQNNIKEPNILNFLDLVSLGTVCDVVPLIGINRAFVKQGLKILKERKNLGLKTLYDLCEIESQPSTYDLGFKLGPRINAGGRVGKSSHGFELLTSTDPKKTYKIALDLNKSNEERKSIELLLIEKVENEVKKFHNQPVLVLEGNDWHEGIIGIVAARIKEKYNKPTILISINNDLAKGSARSIFGFDIGAQIINAVHNGILLKGGGHKMAGGFSIKKSKIHDFRNFLIKNFEKLKFYSTDNLDLHLDVMVAPSALNEEFYNQINILSPFGSGNNEPRFVIENLKVISSKIVGNGHIKSILTGLDGSVFNSIAWNAENTPLEKILSQKYNKKISIAGKMKLNYWKGKKNVEFVIDDIAINKLI